MKLLRWLRRDAKPEAGTDFGRVSDAIHSRRRQPKTVQMGASNVSIAVPGYEPRQRLKDVSARVLSFAEHSIDTPRDVGADWKEPNPWETRYIVALTIAANSSALGIVIWNDRLWNSDHPTLLCLGGAFALCQLLAWLRIWRNVCEMSLAELCSSICIGAAAVVVPALLIRLSM